MIQQPAPLRSTLAQAVGDDPMLVAELRAAFLASARDHAARLASGEAALRREAALRLQGLAASFGAVALMALADRASDGVDAALLTEIDGALALLGE